MIRYPDVPRLMIACAVGITAAHLVFLLAGCGSAQTHNDIHLAAYAADKSLCDKDAVSYDAGRECLDHYTELYAPFWKDGGQ